MLLMDPDKLKHYFFPYNSYGDKVRSQICQRVETLVFSISDVDTILEL